MMTQVAVCENDWEMVELEIGWEMVGLENGWEMSGTEISLIGRVPEYDSEQ